MIGLLGVAMIALAISAPTSLGDGHAVGPMGRAHIERPATKWDPIPFGHARKRQTAKYSARHYGERTWHLRRSDVKTLVLHYTAGSTYAGAWQAFASNAPALGERPGVCAQFVVDKDGTIYQLTRLGVRCRHTIGLNHRSIGIEMVQEDVGSPAATAAAILHRGAQSRAAVRLVAWLEQRYDVRVGDVIGHAMANDSRFFEDRQGWRNDHSDWLPAEVAKFRHRLRKLLHRDRRPPS